MAPIIKRTRQHYQSLEYGKAVPNAFHLIKFSFFFNVSTDYLLGLSDNPARMSSLPEA
jgi:hypothetical protein